jgi:hypothetical protein
MIKALYLLGQNWRELCPPVCAGLVFFGLLYWAVALNLRRRWP